MSPLRGERGQTAAEYMGLLLVVAAIVGTLASAGLPDRVAGAIRAEICRLGGDAASCAAKGAGRRDATRATRVTRSDRDGDGLSNAAEERRGSNPNSADSDGDGLSDREEARLRTDPLREDSDRDGIPDDRERRSGGGLDPTRADSDGDRLADGEELAAGTNPADDDSDGALGARGDGLSDAEEIRRGTDPTVYDTDGDGLPDGHEVDRGSDPLKDERSLAQKLAEKLILDDPIGAALPGGGAAKGAKKVIDDILGGARRVKPKLSPAQRAEVRRERIRELRERLADERGSVDPSGFGRGKGRDGGKADDSNGGKADDSNGGKADDAGDDPRSGTPPPGVPAAPPARLEAFPNATLAKRRTPVKGGGSLRKRWTDPVAKRIYEFDRQHDRVEVYDKRGRHLGEFDHRTGKQTKPADPGRRVDP